MFPLVTAGRVCVRVYPPWCQQDYIHTHVYRAGRAALPSKLQHHPPNKWIVGSHTHAGRTSRWSSCCAPAASPGATRTSPPPYTLAWCCYLRWVPACVNTQEEVPCRCFAHAWSKSFFWNTQTPPPPPQPTPYKQYWDGAHGGGGERWLACGDGGMLPYES